MKHGSYAKRAMQSKDRRFAQVFSKMGYDTRMMAAEKPLIAILREDYTTLTGKRPFMGWHEAALKRKIEELTAPSDEDDE